MLRYNLAAHFIHKIFYVATKIILACLHFAKSGYCRFTKLLVDLPRLLFAKKIAIAQRASANIPFPK
jgi:hypothetical protein